MLKLLKNLFTKTSNGIKQYVIRVRWLLSVGSFHFKNLFFERGQKYKYDIFRHNEIQDGKFGSPIKKKTILSDEINPMTVLKEYVKDVFVNHEKKFNERIGQKLSDMDDYDLAVRMAQTRFDEKFNSATFKYTTFYILPSREQIKIGQTAEQAQDQFFLWEGNKFLK
jgi:hypothetical protein